LALGYNFFGFISKYSVNVLFFDQWDYMRSFFGGHTTLVDLFRLQHGPHREGVGIIADRFLYPLTNWNVRAESFMIGGCVFVAMLLALLLKRRLFGHFSYSDVSIPLMFLTLAQYETFVGGPNASYGGFPLVMLMLYCVALLERNCFLRYGVVLLLNLFLIYDGWGLFMGIVTIGIFALEGYWRLRHITSTPLALPVAALLIAGASLGSFFIRYKFAPVEGFPPRDPLSYPRFMALMFSNFVGLRVPVWATWAGYAILLFALVVLAAQVRRLGTRDCSRDISLILGVLLSYGILFAASTAVGRVSLGLDQAQVSRYATLLIPAFLALYLYLLSTPSGLRRNIGLVLFAVLLVPNAVRVPPGARWLADGKRAWIACYLQTENIEHCDQAVGFVIHPRPENTGLRQKLEYLKQHRLSFFADRVPK
jgi:hypothetical protein